MRLLIPNDVDPILAGIDRRTYQQRALWFARAGDAVVLSAPPDEAFLRHVTALTGTDRHMLAIHIPPPGRFGGKVIDPLALLDADFLRAVAKDARRSPGGIEEIFAMWPSAILPLLADALGVGHLLADARFLAQSGGDLANSKAAFRTLAAGAGAPIVPGAVCHSAQEAEAVLDRLLEQSAAVVVKQAHNGSGAGNQLLVRDADLETGHAGAKHLHRLDSAAGGVRAYLDRYWDWASCGGRYPVVVEQFKPGCRSVYAEFLAEDGGVRHTATGTLVYEDRRLASESTPMRGVPEPVRERFTSAAESLAQRYQTLGYRGYLSIDGIVDEDGSFAFTEVNARVTGSLHIYGPIAQGLAGGAAGASPRTVTQFRVPRRWHPLGVDAFLTAARELGCLYDPGERRGVLVSIPPMPDGVGLNFCTVYPDETQERDAVRLLDARLRR